MLITFLNPLNPNNYYYLKIYNVWRLFAVGKLTAYNEIILTQHY